MMEDEDHETRKTERAKRIQKREEAAKKSQEAAEDVTQRYDFERPDEDTSPVEQQVVDSAALLEHLLADADEKVTNVLVASDAREVDRRFKEEEKRNEILNKLETEANLAREKFDTISSSWDPILLLNDPLDIRDDIDAQKQRCADLIQQKDAIIRELKNELHQADEMYYKDLKKQMNDIKQLSERIDSQVALMKEAYRTQLTMIENSIQIERSLILQENEGKWNNLYEERDKIEENNVETKIAETINFEKKMDDLTAEYRNKYKESKLQLELNIQTLQCELQKIKQTCLINSEKIDYNYQILKKRNEENIMVKSQQKTKLNSMCDIITDLKKQIDIRRKECELDEAIFGKDVQKINNAIMELHNKAESMNNNNEKKYRDAWQMNESRAFELYEEIVNFDKHICENILGIEWTNSRANDQEHEEIIPYYRGINTEYDEDKVDESKILKTEIDVENSALVHHIINLISDNSGFLLEKSLESTLEKHTKTSQMLWKIDNIFNALEVKTEEDIKILCEYFLKHAVCTECNLVGKEIWKKAEYSPKTQQLEKISDLTTEEILLEREAANIIMESSSLEKVEKKETSATMTCPKGHMLKLHTSKVHQALKEFVERNTKQNQTNKKKTSKNKQIVLPTNAKDVKSFWAKFRSPLSKESEKVWDLLLDGLNKYFPVLQERIQLYEEVLALRNENKELQRLLRGSASEFRVED